MALPPTNPPGLVRDAEDLNKVVNGEGTTNRAGDSLPSIKAVFERINDDFDAMQAGELTAQAVDAADRAEAARDASQLSAGIYSNTSGGLSATNEGDYFSVPSSDVDEYLILYRHDAGPVATEIKTYPSAGAVERIREESNEKAEFVDDDALFHLVDVKGNIIALFDKDSGFWLAGIDGSAQQNIRSLNDLIGRTDGEDSVELLTDANGMIVRRQAQDGSLFLPGLAKSVQAEIAEAKEKVVGTDIPDNARDLHNAVVIASMMENVRGDIAFAPLPLEISPTNYDIGNRWMSRANFATETGQEYVPIDTPYNEDDAVVHPYILEIPELFRGFRYVMVITPYPGMNDQLENPVVYGSHDLSSFEMLSDMPQPLADAPSVGGFNYDPYLAYDVHSGELVCAWNTFENVGSGPNTSKPKMTFMRKTKDGINWTESELLYPRTTETPRSACTLFNSNDGYYYMFYTPADNELSFRKNRRLSEEGWSQKYTVDLGAFDRAFWHIECKCVGNRVVVLLNDYRGSGNFYWGVSDPDDWSKFTFDSTPLIRSRASISAKYGSSSVAGAYKATFLPRFRGGNEISFTVAWTPSGSIGLGRKLFINKTNWVEV